MPEDKDVQTPEPVEVTTEEPKGETPKADQPLTEEKVSQMLEAKAEELRRHYQSVADRDIKSARKGERQATRRAETAESQVNVFNRAAATNPQLAAQIRVATQSAQAKAFRERENLDMAEQAKKDYFDKMTGIVEKFGVDPNDKRLDLAEDAGDSIVATDRIMSSISKIVKEDAEKASAKVEEKLRDFETDFRKRYELDSVDKTASSGAGKATFTSAQIADRAFYEENKEEILKAYKEGRIKE